jgi:hypothetical protein
MQQYEEVELSALGMGKIIRPWQSCLAICLLHLLVLLVLLTHAYLEIKIQNCLCAVMIWFTLVRLQLLLIVRTCVFIVKPHEFSCDIH